MFATTKVPPCGCGDVHEAMQGPQAFNVIQSEDGLAGSEKRIGTPTYVTCTCLRNAQLEKDVLETFLVRHLLNRNSELV